MIGFMSPFCNNNQRQHRRVASRQTPPFLLGDKKGSKSTPLYESRTWSRGRCLIVEWSAACWPNVYYATEVCSRADWVIKYLLVMLRWKDNHLYGLLFLLFIVG